jgi:hypothetical protein
MISRQHMPTQPAPNLFIGTGAEQKGQMTFAGDITTPIEMDSCSSLDTLAVDRWATIDRKPGNGNIELLWK